MKRPDTPFPRHWLYYIALKILLNSPEIAWRAFDRHALRVKRSMASFLADETKPFHEPTKERLRKLEGAMAPWFEDSNRSNACRIHAMHDDGLWAFVIRHGDPIARIGIITEKGLIRPVERATIMGVLGA